MFPILVVEDDESLNRLLCTKLRQASYSVFSTFDREEALSCLEREHIDLMICDIIMPKMDGYKLTKFLVD